MNETHYVEEFFSARCIPIEECNHIWPLFVAPLLALIILSTSVLFGVTKETTKIFDILGMFSKSHSHRGGGRLSSHGHSSRVAWSGQDSSADSIEIDTSEPPSVEVDNSELPEIGEGLAEITESSIHKATRKADHILQYLFIIFYFEQDITLYHTDMYDYVTHSSLVLEVLTVKFMRNLFTLHTDILANFQEKTCMFPGITPLQKEAIKSCIYPFIYLVFLLIYLFIFKFGKWLWKKVNFRKFKCWLQKRFSLSKIGSNLALGFLTSYMLSYQRLTHTAINMVDCVPVNDTKVILLDGSIQCYTWWQYIVWFYIICCILSFPIYMVLSPNWLRERTVTIQGFIVGLLFPLPALIYHLFSFIFGWDLVTKGKQKSKKNNTQENIADIMAAYFIGSYESFWDGKINWSGIVLAFRCILIFLSVMVHDCLLRIILMFSTSITSLIAHMIWWPSTTNRLNLVSTFCQGVIVIVGACNLVLAALEWNQYEPHEDDTVVTALVLIIDIFSVYIPVICITVFVLYGVYKLLFYICKLIYFISNLVFGCAKSGNCKSCCVYYRKKNYESI